jgi:hypothetical protein
MEMMMDTTTLEEMLEKIWDCEDEPMFSTETTMLDSILRAKHLTPEETVALLEYCRTKMVKEIDETVRWYKGRITLKADGTLTYVSE